MPSVAPAFALLQEAEASALASPRHRPLPATYVVLAERAVALEEYTLGAAVLAKLFFTNPPRDEVRGALACADFRCKQRPRNAPAAAPALPPTPPCTHAHPAHSFTCEHCSCVRCVKPTQLLVALAWLR